MPVKKSVRFLENPVVHRLSHPKSRRAPVPLPPYSSSTMTSSAGPITPPHPIHRLPYGSRYPPIYQPMYQSMPLPKAPSSSYQGVSLHSYFIPHKTHRPNPELIQWNLLDHHSMVTRGRHHLLHPASHPPLPFIRILIPMNVSPRHPHPYWTCRVHASNHRFVTVLDVLDSLYNSLRRNIAALEFNSLSEEDKSSTSRYYKKRYRRLQDYNSHLSEQEKVQGMKRIDFLMGRTRFAGLIEGHQPDEFHLKVT